MKAVTTRILAAVIAAPLAMPVWAEQHAASDTSATATTETTAPDASAVVVKVGDTEITAGEVQSTIEGFPPQILQTQPAESLIPLAVDQLILRELILQKASEEGVSEDPAVETVMNENAERTREDAIVQVYVQQQVEGAITDEAVQATYDEVAANTENELPPIEAVRPQIEQQLRQERLVKIREDLMNQDIEIVYYDESGNPVSAKEAGAIGATDNASTDAEVGAEAEAEAGAEAGANVEADADTTAN